MSPRLTVVLVLLLLATPALIFWIWLVTLPARVAKLCPAECWCSPGGQHVDCSNLSLNRIPLTFPTDVRILKLDLNNITSLKNNSLISRGLTELHSLSAFFGELKTIQLGAFNGLTKLKHLMLAINKIIKIIPGTFEKMSRLQFLDLSHNRIKHLKVDVFRGLVNLVWINIAGNKLKYLQPDTFVGLSNLESVALFNNPGLKIPTDSHFINSHSLTSLSISDCNISTVSVETFANVTALEGLDLHNNNLKSVDINILKALPKLSALYLRDNPLQCDCQLQEVWRWCQDHNIETATSKVVPECDTPSEVNGIWWGVLEKGQCLNGNISYYGDYENTTYNYTPVKERGSKYGRWTFLIKVAAPVYVFPCIFCTAGNMLVLITIICNKDMRTVPNMYILNLAVSDMIFLMVQLSQVYADTVSGSWQYGEIMCKFFPFCRRLSVGLSAYSVAVLSIQRYNVTVNSFHIQVSSQPTWRGTVATICGVWIVAALFAIPSALLQTSCYNSFLLFSYTTYNERVVLFELLVSCVLPLCLIAFFYIMTARHLVKNADPISEGTKNPQLNTRKKTAKIVLGLTVVFLISYVPYHVFWTYIVFKELPYVTLGSILQIGYNFQLTDIVSTGLLLTNSCLNPVALFGTSSAFRRQLKHCFTCCCKRRSPSNDVELTRRN